MGSHDEVPLWEEIIIIHEINNLVRGTYPSYCDGYSFFQ